MPNRQPNSSGHIREERVLGRNYIPKQKLYVPQDMVIYRQNRAASKALGNQLVRQ